MIINASGGLRPFLKAMSKRGFWEVLTHIEASENTHYNDVLKFALEEHLVESRASVTTILNSLTSMGLLERTVLDTRPMRTRYSITKKGRTVLHLLKQLEKETE